MLDFKIDQKKCIKCKLCAQECPVMIINGKTDFPEIKEGKESQCIKCQHCLAVCPTGALSIFGKNPDDSVPLRPEILRPEDLSNLIKTRRSVRKFKKEEISYQQIHELLETTAYAPSGHNKNQVLLSLTETKDELAKVRSLVYNAIKKANEAGTIPPEMAIYSRFQNMWETKGIDILFRNAPHLIVASGPKSNDNTLADCVISLSYFELLANAKGIGTLWNGFLKVVFEHIAPELLNEIGIPEDHAVGYVMIFGLPAVKFARSIQSEGLNLNRINL